MKILKNTSVLKKAINKISDLGYVPTMGGLHRGHISLIKESQKKCKKTIVSIYVNPKQFNDKNDFLKYPRNIKKDLTLLKKNKVDYVFTPTTKDVYNLKSSKKIVIKKSEKILCAKFRKGHFEGVLDVMDRLINLINPNYIMLGKKDFQQYILIKNFIKDKYKSKIYPCKTVRDKNNVALSTRNNLLNNNDLTKVGLISTIIKKTKPIIKQEKYPNKFLNILKKKIIKRFNIKIDYLQIRNEYNLQKFDRKKKYRIFIAYYINNVRLIDNF
jgi:pantoate--beta-alanine ligase